MIEQGFIGNDANLIAVRSSQPSYIAPISIDYPSAVYRKKLGDRLEYIDISSIDHERYAFLSRKTDAMLSTECRGARFKTTSAIENKSHLPGTIFVNSS